MAGWWRRRVALLRLRKLLRRRVVAVGLLDRLTEPRVSRHCRRILLIPRIHALAKPMRQTIEDSEAFWLSCKELQPAEHRLHLVLSLADLKGKCVRSSLKRKP
jgi:hypothetical protein